MKAMSLMRSHKFRRGALPCAIAGPLAALVSPNASHAAEQCAGDFFTTQVSPWPADVTFNLPLREANSTSKARDQAFRTGLQETGLPLDRNGKAILDIVFTIRPGPRSQPGTFEGGVYNDLSWRSTSASGDTLNDPSLLGFSLNFTVVASESKEHRHIWIGSMICTIQTSDTQALARDIASSLGKALIASIHRP